MVVFKGIEGAYAPLTIYMDYGSARAFIQPFNC